MLLSEFVDCSTTQGFVLLLLLSNSRSFQPTIKYTTEAWRGSIGLFQAVT